ncbi:MAG: DMT family transporter [Pseudomonadota bacterium]|nr:DMT family transporter [Pseudomonadota bacterium]
MTAVPATITAIYAAIPSPVRGVLFMMISAIGVVAMNVSIRNIADDIHPFVIALFRHSIGVCLLAPLILRRDHNPFRTGHLPLHGLRALFNVIAMLAYFVALTMEPLAKVVALTFTAPLLATVGAVLILREKVSRHRYGALAIGLAGALIILRPWAVEISTGSLLLLLSSSTWAMALVVIKVLSRHDNPVTIALYASLLQVPFCLVAASFFWQWPTPYQWFIIFLIAIFGSTTQICLAQAFREADATVVLPADFTKLVFAGLAGWLFFSELPEIWIWIGGTIVFSGVFLNTWFEKRARDSSGLAQVQEVSQTPPNSNERPP